MLFSFIGFVVSVLNNGVLNEYLASRLYNLRSDTDRKRNTESIDQTILEQSQSSRPCLRGMKLSLLSFLPSCCETLCCVCCRLNSKERTFKRAQERYEQEADIIEIIRLNRLFKSALNRLFSVSDITKMRQDTQLESLSKQKTHHSRT